MAFQNHGISGTSVRSVFFVLCALVPLCAPSLFAADEEKSLLERQPDGWVDMLPPKDLAGWHRAELDPLSKDNVWHYAEDGKTFVIDGFNAKEMLLTDKHFGDGTFHVEWRLLKEKPGQKMLNGGIYVRSLDNQNWVQAQTAYTGGKTPRNGDLFSEFMEAGKKKRVETLSKDANREKPLEEWNTYELHCSGRQVSLWVNGAITATWTDCPIEKGSFGFQAEWAAYEIRVAKFKPVQPAK